MREGREEAERNKETTQTKENILRRQTGRKPRDICTMQSMFTFSRIRITTGTSFPGYLSLAFVRQIVALRYPGG